MKSYGLLAALVAVVSVLGVIGSSQPAFAAVHCMRVYGVMGAVNGDTTIQYVELRMAIGGQVFTNMTQLHFYDASGTEIDTDPGMGGTQAFTLVQGNAFMPATGVMGGNMVNGQAGASILLATEAFDAQWPSTDSGNTIHPDFKLPSNFLVPNGKVSFGFIGNCNGESRPYDSLAYGGGSYTGGVDYNMGGQQFTSSLPTSGNQAIQIKSGSFDSDQGTPNDFGTMMSNGNSTDYEIVSDPMPCKNAPSGSPVCGAVNASGDTDGDGVPNGIDLCPGTAAMAAVDANGCSDAQVDSDGDGICNPGAPSAGPSNCTGSDNCPNASNAGQSNVDSDALGDACDTEGPSPNTNGVGGANDCGDTVDNDGDTLVDLADPNCSNTDNDGDGVPDLSDNCPTTPNPGQQNFDGDSQGDACDLDDDNDGYSDDAEAGSPVCAGAVNDDNIDDGLTNDGCPAVGAAESNCANTLDDDSDGRVNDGCTQSGTISEGGRNIGTGTVNPCDVGATAPSPSWPSDIISGGTPNSTDRVTITDLTSFIAPTRRLGTSPDVVPPPGSAFNQRWDLVPGRQTFSTWIAITDLTALFAGATGYPTMFGGAAAFSGPTCTGP